MICSQAFNINRGLFTQQCSLEKERIVGDARPFFFARNRATWLRAMTRELARRFQVRCDCALRLQQRDFFLPGSVAVAGHGGQGAHEWIISSSAEAVELNILERYLAYHFFESLLAVTGASYFVFLITDGCSCSIFLINAVTIAELRDSSSYGAARYRPPMHNRKLLHI